MKTLLKLTIAGASLGVLAGCATQASTEDLQAQIDAAMATAEGAQRTADDNAEKIDRMFERSMYK
ncbi:MAG: hypothetical protein FKY71_04120 [Spiribacter salinus]|uniref:Murein lipoprotein n=1 Tax=Spiribacter salinus TaxID=1335746 RepID=A0A540VU71_9GAMM|nr:MAG: hypothetical protein FKY71_04120 [Spiribacter salinus]